MPIIEKNVGARLSIADQDIYTVPALTTTRVLMNRVTNTDNSADVDATVSWVDADGPGLISLQQPFDLAKVREGGNVINVNALDTSAVNMGTVSLDGLNVYVVEDTEDRIYQYVLPTSGDLKNAVLTNTLALNTALPSMSQTINSITFSKAGTRLYLTSQSDDTVFQMNLSVAWDISTAVNSGNTYTFSGVTIAATDFEINEEGTTMLVFSAGNAFSFTLSTPWDISTTTYDSINKTVGSGSGIVGGTVDSTGTYIYALTTDNNLRVTTLATPWLLQSAGTPSAPVLLSPWGSSAATTLAMGTDDTTIYLLNRTGQLVCRLTLGSAGSLADLYITGRSVDPGTLTTVSGLVFSPDGLLMTLGSSLTTTATYVLAEAFDPSTIVGNSPLLPAYTGTLVANPTSLFFSSDGMLLFSSDTTTLSAYSVDTPFTCSGAALVGTETLAGLLGFDFSADGSQVSWTTAASVLTKRLSTPWDLSTAENSEDPLLTFTLAGHTGFKYADDGFTFYSYLSNVMYKHVMTEAYNPSTAVLASSVDITGISTEPYVIEKAASILSVNTSVIDIFSVPNKIIDQSVHPLLSSTTVPATESIAVVNGGLVLEAGDKIRVSASSSGSLDITLALQEIS